MKTILLTNHYEGKPLEILQNAVGDDFELLVLPAADREALLDAAGAADYLIVSGRLSIDREVIDRAGKVRMIQRTGVGLDHIDLSYLRKRGIPLYVNQGVNANSVAEYTVMLMLAALKRSYAVNRRMRAGIWKKQETALTTHEIQGRIVGIVGMGNIGRRVARMLSGFDVKILYTDVRRLPEGEEAALHASWRSFDELLKQTDILTLHCPYDPSQGYLITEKQFAMMKDGAVLINTARGGLVKQQALCDALKSGRLSAAGIDVFEEEPQKDRTELDGCDDALLSPHIAGLSCETFARMMQLAVDNIRAFDRGDYRSIASSLYTPE